MIGEADALAAFHPTPYFRRNFDMHWTDGYSTAELAEMDRKSAEEGRRKSTLNNIVPILDELVKRIKRSELERDANEQRMVQLERELSALRVVARYLGRAYGRGLPKDVLDALDLLGYAPSLPGNEPGMERE